jgi:simple sugar transport system ATP-binding protein
MVTLRGIGKYFPSNGVTALENADFELRPGEIHALVGENGAGKSTLMHILAGRLKGGAGKIYLDRKEAVFHSTADALKAGIGMVLQHPTLVPGFKVWEDCILGAEPHTAGLLRPAAARRLVCEISGRWGFDLPIDQKTETLTASQRQKAAVLALILREAAYLILDEATAVLTPRETASLFELLSALKSAGKGIVLISHKLEETLRIADRITVIRRGRTQGTWPAVSLNMEKLGSLMFGPAETAESGFPPGTPAFSAEASARKKAAGEALLNVEKLSVAVPGRPLIRGIDLSLTRGKILGIAGVRDSGLETLELALTGFLPPSEGSIILKGRELAGRGPAFFREAGGAYLGTKHSMAKGLPLGDSIVIHAYRRSLRGLPGRFGIMAPSFLSSWIRTIMHKAEAVGNPRLTGNSFSGGTLQRIALARELAEKAPLLVLAEPGWGLDRNSRKNLAEELRAYREKGGGILIFSTDVDELLSVCDTILVLRNGFFSGRVDPQNGVPAENPAEDLKAVIGRAMVGEDEPAA